MPVATDPAIRMAHERPSESRVTLPAGQEADTVVWLRRVHRVDRDGNEYLVARPGRLPESDQPVVAGSRWTHAARFQLPLAIDDLSDLGDRASRAPSCLVLERPCTRPEPV